MGTNTHTIITGVVVSTSIKIEQRGWIIEKLMLARREYYKEPNSYTLERLEYYQEYMDRINRILNNGR